MNYLKELFYKGRFHLYIGFGVLFEVERAYYLQKTSLYKKIKEDVQ